MGLVITASGAEHLKSSVWQLEMPPHQIRLFGDCRRAEGERSVLLVSGARFDADAKTLAFDVSAVTPLNIGKSNIAIVIGEVDSVFASNNDDLLASAPWTEVPPSTGSMPLPFIETLGPGDREFLAVANEMPRLGRETADLLLAEIRKRSPGDLRRGQQRNFSNTPDNFWYVVVQPRIGELSVTVRGEPDRFRSETLTLKQDRPGYTRFKVAKPEDVSEAVRIIFASKRRK